MNPAPLGTAKKPLEILLVEDSPGDIRLIQEMLRGLPEPGCTLTCRHRLSEAQGYLQVEHPEVILMDLGLPDANDLEAMEGIRRLAMGIPVVVLTGLDDEGLAHRALEQGAQDYLVKGRFDAQMLLRSLRYAMDRQRREAALRANLVSTFLHCVVGDDLHQRSPSEAARLPSSEGPGEAGFHSPPLPVDEEEFHSWFLADSSHLTPGTSLPQERELRLQQVANQLQTLSRQLVDVQEHERYTLSRELHDRVGQNLTALGLDLDLIGRHLSEGNLPALELRLKECRKLARSTSEMVSNVMAELRPQMLDDYGLAPALEWYAAQWSQRTGIPVKIRRSASLGRMPAPVEIGLFRIGQEALTNIAKHAQASQVWILVASVGKRLRMIIADNGRGIPRHPRPAHLGHGMLIMRERAKSLHGRFYARPRGLGGTLIEVDLQEGP